MARTKLVNGKEVPLTPEEEAARDAEEAAWANRPRPTQDQINQDLINKTLAEPGSIVRAIAEIQFMQLKGTIVVNPLLTVAQYKDLLKSKM